MIIKLGQVTVLLLTVQYQQLRIICASAQCSEQDVFDASGCFLLRNNKNLLKDWAQSYRRFSGLYFHSVMSDVLVLKFLSL